VSGEKLAALAQSKKRKREPEARRSPSKVAGENSAPGKSVVEGPLEAHVLDGLTDETNLATAEASTASTEDATLLESTKQAGIQEKETDTEGHSENGTGKGKAEATRDNGVKENREEAEAEQKDWEKLPKQDEAAAALLEDSPLPNDLTWIDPTTVEGYAEMGSPTTTDTAQVHPFHFTTRIAALAEEAGVKIKTMARVMKVLASATALEGVEYVDRKSGESHTITDATDVVVCAGPWTGKLMPKTKVHGLRAHSVVWEADVSAYAVFTDIDLPPDYVPEHRARMGQKKRHKGRVDPEIYARPFGEVYACGEPHPYSSSLSPGFALTPSLQANPTRPSLYPKPPTRSSATPSSATT
jgi:glycine/D-amino acid oxidase-like deaminating enzyme